MHDRVSQGHRVARPAGMIVSRRDGRQPGVQRVRLDTLMLVRTRLELVRRAG
jgi:hypothetical protein